MEQSKKRIYRNMPDKHRQAISNALKGRKHSEQHKINISKGLEKHWSHLVYKPVDNNNDKNTTGNIYEN